jgi:hypothetical protein
MSKDKELSAMLERAAALLKGQQVLQLDAPQLPDNVAGCTAIFGRFLWSQVRREQQEQFLAQLRAKVGTVPLVLLDENYVDGSSLPVARTDADGNTFEFRVDAAGQRAEFIRNHPADSYLRKKFGGAVREIRIERSDYYWLLSCRLK